MDIAEMGQVPELLSRSAFPSVVGVHRSVKLVVLFFRVPAFCSCIQRARVPKSQERGKAKSGRLAHLWDIVKQIYFLKIIVQLQQIIQNLKSQVGHSTYCNKAV